jgi:hypothetical protein
VTSLTCTLCSAGSYCNDVGQIDTTAPCDAGYYCPGGQSTGSPSEYVCPAGSSCGSGSSEHTPCEAGTYQDESGASECKTCPEGYFATVALRALPIRAVLRATIALQAL